MNIIGGKNGRILKSLTVSYHLKPLKTSILKTSSETHKNKLFEFLAIVLVPNSNWAYIFFSVLLIRLSLYIISKKFQLYTFVTIPSPLKK